MRIAALLFLSTLAAAGAAHGQGFSACAWGKVSPAIHAEFVATYAQGMTPAMDALAAHDAEMVAAAQACAPGGSVPKGFVQAALGSKAIQEGASARTKALAGIDRPRLIQAWAEAPEAARQCYRANAGKVVGIKDQVCGDERAPLAMLPALGLSTAPDKLPAAKEAMIYFNAYAQSEWVDAFVIRATHGSGPAPAPGAPNTATLATLSVTQMATDDVADLKAQWEKQAPGVALKVASSAPAGRPLDTFIIFKGCAVDAAGRCDLTAEFETVGPDGKSRNRSSPAQVWVGPAPQQASNFQLGREGYRVIFLPTDPLGPYVVSATITDHVSGAVLHTRQTLTAVAK